MTDLLKRLAFIRDVLPSESIALSSDTQRLSYVQMLDAIERRIEWLRESGANVVALHAGNSIEWVLFDLACQALELVFIPLPAFFSESQIKHCITQSGVDTLLSDDVKAAEAIACLFDAIPLYRCDATDSRFHAWRCRKPRESRVPVGTQKITFTSGSTGNPKGVCLSMDHQGLVAQSLADAIAIQRPRHLCLLPLSTLLENIAGVYTPLLCGGEVIILPDSVRGFMGSSGIDEAALLGCINDVKPDSLILVPQLLLLLVYARNKGWEAPESLKFIAVGGGKVAPQLIEEARQLGLPVYQGYGLSECGSVVALNTPANDRVARVGRILPHVDVAIKDNEIIVSGAIHLGYMGDPSSWYPDKVSTGDIGVMDKGFLSIEGRSKNTLITSYGRNISPEWIESVLMSKPFLKRCVVFGDAKPCLAALVSVPDGIADDNIQYWIDCCNQSLPDYAQVGVWLSLPDQELRSFMTANDRPQREKIKANYEEKINQLYERIENQYVPELSEEKA